MSNRLASSIKTNKTRLASALCIPLVFVIIGRLHDAVSPITGPLPLAKLLIPLTYLALIMVPLLAMMRSVMRTPQARGYAAFVFAILLSVPFSYYPSASLQFAIQYITQSVPVCLVLAIGMRSIEDMERVLKGAVVMLLVMGALLIGGFGIVHYGEDGARATLAGSYDPNDLALVVASNSAFAVWALRDKSRLWRFLGLVALALSAFIIAKTYSRGGAIAFGAVILLSVFVTRVSMPGWIRVALVPAVLLALLFTPADYRDRLSSLKDVSQDYNATTESGRIAVWKRGAGYFLDRPLNGVGVGQYVVAEGDWGARHGLSAGWQWMAAHNMYVESSAELGIVGILGLLTMLIPTALWSRKIFARRAMNAEQVRVNRVGEALFLSVVAFLVGAMFLSAALAPMVLLLTALGIAYRRITTEGAPAASAANVRSAPRRAYLSRFKTPRRDMIPGVAQHSMHSENRATNVT